MKKKRAAVALLTSCIALTATMTGCSLVSTNNQNDMEQIIATVDITKSENIPQNLSAYTSAVKSASIVKRELVSYFINVGYSYVQNGTSYKDTFNMLMDALIDNAVLTQYSTMQLIASANDLSVLNTFNSFDKEVDKYVYLLGGEKSDDVLLAKYSLFKSLNSAIDNYEQTIIDEEDEYAGTDTRTTPTNLDAETDDYYPHASDGGLDYNIYTGYAGYLLSDSGKYEEDALDGTTRATRVKAYNSFINNLRQNNLISEGENLTDVWNIEYIQNEYVRQLESRIINKYYELYEDEQEEKLKNESYSYVKNRYEEIVNNQKDSYTTASAFESALDGMSSTSFITYSPDTTDSDKFDGVNNGRYGFVYNILLPFSARQSVKLAELNSVLSANDKKNEFYIERNKLLKDITTTDQRSAWFNGATKYAFKASDSDYTADYFGKTAGRDYLFFENNLTESGDNGRYKELQAYDGRYSYNGKAYLNGDGSYTLLANKLSIDGMLAEFSSYINYVLGSDSVTFDNGYNPSTGNEAYYSETNFIKPDTKDEVDYSKFIYASGKVDIGEFNPSDLMNYTDKPKQYKAMSAVNELQFAYTTDTGVLSKYVGYTVSAYDTSYIKEFEYACKKAILNGEGSFAVCAGDYGWHLIYVTYAFDVNGGEVNENNLDWSRIDTEGTFENLFFEWIKQDMSNITTIHRSKIISDYNKESTVVKYQKRYQDLLDLEN